MSADGRALAARWVRVPSKRPALRAAASAERLALTAVCSLGAAWVHTHHDPGVLCPLRRLTGVPCPICGSTTVFMEAGAGHWSAALTANPFTVVAALVFLVAPVLAVDPVRTWVRLPQAWRLWPLGIVVAASWLWQLHRFGWL